MWKEILVGVFKMERISEKDVESFIRNYVGTLERLIKGKYPQVKTIRYKSGFPLEFPVKAVAYLGKRGIHIRFDKSDQFEVSIKKNERVKVKGQWSQFLLYPHFSRIKYKASEKAESDIQNLLSLPKMIEEHEREMERYYQALWFEEMSYVIEHYIKFLDETKIVVDKTKTEKMEEVYNIINVIRNHLSRFEFVLRVGCQALNRLYFMINSDMETSFFLALNGKYYAAISVLRKILEVNVRCVYLDSLQNGTQAERYINEWLNGGRFPKRFNKIVDALVSDEINQRLTDLLKRLGIFEDHSFKDSVVSLYSTLCLYVHLRPQTSWVEDLTLSFSEFNADSFTQFCRLFNEVIKISDVLLILKFPQIVSASNFTGFVFSKEQLEALAEFFRYIT